MRYLILNFSHRGTGDTKDTELFFGNSIFTSEFIRETYENIKKRNYTFKYKSVWI